MQTPERQIRAVFNESTIRVYQAYADPIANAALDKGTFCGPFKMSRMTWIKPSFLWMMYRCGWAQKEGQNRVLGIDISRDGFEWALARGCLSHFDHKLHSSEDEWKRTMDSSPVRIQWDPERTITLGQEDFRSIQIGLSGEAVHLYVNNWIQSIEEITDLATEVRAKVASDNLSAAKSMLPFEAPYPISEDIAKRLGISTV